MGTFQKCDSCGSPTSCSRRRRTARRRRRPRRGACTSRPSINTTTSACTSAAPRRVHAQAHPKSSGRRPTSRRCARALSCAGRVCTARARALSHMHTLRAYLDLRRSKIYRSTPPTGSPDTPHTRAPPAQARPAPERLSVGHGPEACCCWRCGPTALPRTTRPQLCTGARATASAEFPSRTHMTRGGATGVGTSRRRRPPTPAHTQHAACR